MGLGRTVLLALSLSWVVSCATVAPAPPTAAATIVRESPLSIRVMPAFAFEGGAIWVSCFVPESLGDGRIRYGIEGQRVSEAQLDRQQYRLLVEHLSCGQWRAVCVVMPLNGREQRREQTVVVKGTCDGSLHE